MAIPKIYVSVEMADGTEHEDVRVTLQDQLQWSDTARKRGWDPTDESTAAAFGAWHALKRNGLYDGEWLEFRNRDAVSVGAVDKAGAAADEAGAGEDDPTQRTAPTH